MSFIRSFWRQKKSRQNGLTEVQFSVNGTSLEVSGVDKFFVKSVESLGTGQYLIKFHEGATHDIAPFFLNVVNGIGHIPAVTEDSITVNTKNFSGAAANRDFSVGLIWLYTNFVH
jgi:hypothetical protein